MPHQWVTFTPKISVLAQKMGSGERACVRGFYWREGTSCVSDTGLPSLTSVMSRLQGDISLVIRISTITENFGHIMGHIKKAFWAKKIGPGWQGGSKTVIFWPKYGFGALPRPLNEWRTPEIDCNMSHWRPLNDLRWVWDILFWSRTFFLYIYTV